MMHAELVVDVGDKYCPEERLLDASIMAKHNTTPLGPARILERIPEGLARGMKRACHGSNDDTMSIASGNNSASAGSHYANSVDSPTMFSPQALQHQQAAAHHQMNAQPTAVLKSLQQRALQEQVMCQAMQQQQALQQQA
eukprot:12571074-Ditylum_brightwellii.AAC.1